MLKMMLPLVETSTRMPQGSPNDRQRWQIVHLLQSGPTQSAFLASGRVAPYYLNVCGFWVAERKTANKL
jgi:hypothetical protein